MDWIQWPCLLPWLEQSSPQHLLENDPRFNNNNNNNNKKKRIHPDNWILCTRRYNEVTLIKLPRARKRRRGEGARKERLVIAEGGCEREREKRDETAHKAKGVIESGAVIQSSQDAVMKLPLSSILSAWHGQLPAPPQLSKKLCCISD